MNQSYKATLSPYALPPSLPSWGDLEGCSTGMVTDNSSIISQGFLYAPFGEIISEYTPGWETDRIPKYAFNAKELDEENGMYYYSARYYAPPTFISRDPLMDEKPWLTPYHYCSNNPVNKVDPTGEEDGPVFGSDGTFRGTTIEGYEGQVIITDAPVNFSNMTEVELLNTSGGTLAFTFDFAMSTNILSNDAKSKIYTHIVGQLQGEKIFDKTFSIHDIHGSKIHFSSSFQDSWGISKNKMESSGKHKIIGSGKYKYETTVENIQCSIAYHEWYGHKEEGYSDENGSHSCCYEAVIDSPLFVRTTAKYQRFIFNQLNFYKKWEGRYTE